MASSAHAEVRMVARPASVPAARRFVSDALTRWGREALAPDVDLCVSELATNSTLHSGSTFFEVELEELADAVRVSVADSGMGSVDALARQPELSDVLTAELTAAAASATGRGMFLVSALASSWGIDELPAGKRVWAVFRPGPPGEEGEAAPTTPRTTYSEERPTPQPGTEDWVVVRFSGCPAALLIAHDDNIAEYIRELQLLGDRLDEPSFQRLGDVMAGFVDRHAPNWDPARILAHEAVRDGREHVDIEVLVSRDVRTGIEALRRLIDEVESLSRADRLITLPAPEPVQRLRDWLAGEFVAQVEEGAEPLPYPSWAAGVRR